MNTCVSNDVYPIAEENPYTLCLYYNPVDNVFTDDDGFIIWCVLEMVTPNDLYLFRKLKRNLIVRHRNWKEVYCELCYLDAGDIASLGL